ncbi:hypothetical protein PISMIDRAFT_424009 [Pisolithus microcarpus 441]|uniref:Uncharacterized protein n=1 Tax=Pisolithus microcarpus 441 TaxID=765257 RepID=A0A0C9YXS5_9AGAM|nr:hypothetical protein PISMIDRAFT_424009 [Pisolithus microcarpus 441]
MRTKILDGFPTDPQMLQQSFVPPLLSTTSSFFFNLPSDVLHGDESCTICRYERNNADVWLAMAILSSIAFETATPRKSMSAGFKERKTSVSAHDVTALRNLNIQPPTDSSTAVKALGDVVAVILQMLKVRGRLILSSTQFTFRGSFILLYCLIHGLWTNARTFTSVLVANGVTKTQETCYHQLTHKLLTLKRHWLPLT